MLIHELLNELRDTVSFFVMGATCWWFQAAIASDTATTMPKTTSARKLGRERARVIGQSYNVRRGTYAAVNTRSNGMLPTSRFPGAQH
jgi:hypothetical protein